MRDGEILVQAIARLKENGRDALMTVEPQLRSIVKRTDLSDYAHRNAEEALRMIGSQ